MTWPVERANCTVDYRESGARWGRVSPSLHHPPLLLQLLLMLVVAQCFNLARALTPPFRRQLID